MLSWQRGFIRRCWLFDIVKNHFSRRMVRRGNQHTIGTKMTKSKNVTPYVNTYKTVNVERLKTPLKIQMGVTKTPFVQWLRDHMPSAFRPSDGDFKKMRGCHRHHYEHDHGATWYFSYDIVETLCHDKKWAWLRHCTDKRIAAYAVKQHGPLPKK